MSVTKKIFWVWWEEGKENPSLFFFFSGASSLLTRIGRTQEFLEQELSPSPTNTEDRRVGEGRRAPGMTVQSLKFHPGGG